MGKLSNMLYMIDLLNTGNIYTIHELAERIGVTERMVRYYKNEICKNGIAIESFKGPNGGYFMIDKIKNYTSINKYDLQLLENVLKQLEKIDFEYLDKYRYFLDKSKKMFSIYDEKSKFISNIDINEIGNKEIIIKNAIDKSDKIEIIYHDITGEQSKRIIHPLQIFQYDKESYVTAFCELRNDIRHFEIKRIENIK